MKFIKIFLFIIIFFALLCNAKAWDYDTDNKKIKDYVIGKYSLEHCKYECGREYGKNTIWGDLNFKWCIGCADCARCLDVCESALEEHRNKIKQKKETIK